jgi:hypothetical protein
MNKNAKEKLKVLFYFLFKSMKLSKPVNLNKKTNSNVFLIASSSPSHLISFLKQINNAKINFNLLILGRTNHIQIAKKEFPNNEYLIYNYDGLFECNNINKVLRVNNAEEYDSLFFLCNNSNASGYENILKFSLNFEKDCFVYNIENKCFYLSIDNIKERLNNESLCNSLIKWYKHDYIK